MKITQYLFVLAFLPSVIVGQVEPDTSSTMPDPELIEQAKTDADSAAAAQPDPNWKVNGSFSLTATNISLSNWQAGGVDALAGAAILNVTPYYEKGKITWVSNLVLAYGMNRQDDITFKTDDRIDIQSNLNYGISENWNFSTLINFRTQFIEGFKSPGDNQRFSNFMAPAYTTYGLGFTYKPKSTFLLYLSPATAKYTFVLDDSLANVGVFGVEPGQRFRAEYGGYLNLLYKQKIGKKIDIQTRLDLFSNYMENPQNIDVSAEILFFWKINSLFSFNLALNLMYDDDILFPVDRGGGEMGEGPRTQTKTVVGVGFAYTF